MRAERPTAVAWIVALTRIRLVLSLLAIGAALFFLSPSESESLEAFRTGWVRAGGYTVETYGPEQAGEVAGAALVPAILSVLMLVFVRRRKLKALQVAAVVTLIVGWTQPLSLPIALLIVVLSYRGSTKDYFSGTGKARPAPSRPLTARKPAITAP